MSLSVDTNDTAAGLMDSSDKDGLSTDAVHVDTCAGLNVIEVHIAKLGDEVDHIILGAHLKQREERRGRESVRREEREERERERGERRREEKREERREEEIVEREGERKKREKRRGKRERERKKLRGREDERRKRI